MHTEGEVWKAQGGFYVYSLVRGGGWGQEVGIVGVDELWSLDTWRHSLLPSLLATTYLCQG